MTLTSPCDPTASYCEINILEYNTEFEERGSGYFSVCNLGRTNAYDIKILFTPKTSSLKVTFLTDIISHTYHLWHRQVMATLTTENIFIQITT